MAKANVEPKLTAEQLKLAMTYDPETGVFLWRERSNVRSHVNTLRAGKPVGTISKNGYIQVVIDRGRFYAHRLAWLYMTGETPGTLDIDHINGVRTDNRIANLRVATRSQNNWNAGVPNHNTSGFRGVHWHAKARKWQATINRHRQSHYLGLYDTAEEARAAYVEAAARLHGEFTKTG